MRSSALVLLVLVVVATGVASGPLRTPVIYLVLCFWFGLAGGIVGRIKGSSFFLWFLISALVPVLGLLAALALPLRPRRAAPPVPGLRQDRQAPRRDLHALRHRARVPRGRDRARIGCCAPIDSAASASPSWKELTRR